MKYRYSKLAFICISVLVCAVVMLLLYLYGVMINADDDKFIKVFMICPLTFFVFVIGYSSEFNNRYVEIFDEYIKFNSFRFKWLRNVISLNIRYEDIISIKTKSLPLFGIWAIKINAKNIPHEITLSICFKHHKIMFKNICLNVIEHNKDIYIDSSIQNLINEK